MRLLIDTHIALWWVGSPERLTASQHDVLADPANSVYLSSIVLAEVAVKRSVGELTLPETFERTLLDEGLLPLAFTALHATALRSIPLHHRDPFDRMLVSQAIADDLTIVTADARMRAYEVRTLD